MQEDSWKLEGSSGRVKLMYMHMKVTGVSLEAPNLIQT